MLGPMAIPRLHHQSVGIIYFYTSVINLFICHQLYQETIKHVSALTVYCNLGKQNVQRQIGGRQQSDTWIFECVATQRVL